VTDHGNIFHVRQEETTRRLETFRRKLDEHLADDRATVIGKHTCIYATGSGGRGELSRYSDLDAFVLRVDSKRSSLDATLIQSAILRATRACGFPDPSREGEFLKMHTASELMRLFGTPQDDVENTFTARMLLLLESTPIVGEMAYWKAVRTVVDAYWRNYKQHQDDYLPIILLNDIVRYWRIVLLNYEAKNTPDKEAANNPTLNADRRLRSYKLRFSRCMTCFSAIAYLLAATKLRRNNVSTKDVLDMVRTRPLDRLEWIADRFNQHPNLQRHIEELLDLYALFLRETNKPKIALLRQFQREEYCRKRSREGTRFGHKMFELIADLGTGNPLYRYLVV
jgi:hypothetical protein